MAAATKAAINIRVIFMLFCFCLGTLHDWCKYFIAHDWTYEFILMLRFAYARTFIASIRDKQQQMLFIPVRQLFLRTHDGSTGIWTDADRWIVENRQNKSYDIKIVW